MSIQDDLDPDDPTSKEIEKLTGTGDIYVSRSTPDPERRREERRLRRERFRREPTDRPDPMLNLDTEPHPEQTPDKPPTGYRAARRREYEIIEKPFAEVSGKLRTIGTGLREEARGDFGPRKRERPVFVQRADPEQVMGELDTEKPKVTYVKATTPPVIAEGAGLTLRAGASAFDAFTSPVRPLFMAGSLAGTSRIVFNEKDRTEFLAQVQADPRGFGADIIGGVVGGYALGRFVGGVRQAYTRRKYGLDIPDEAFFHPDESIMGGGRDRIPKPVDTTRIDSTLLKTTETRTLADSKFGKFTDSAKTKFGGMDFESKGTLWDKARQGFVPSGGQAAELVPTLTKPVKIDYVIPVTFTRTGYGATPGFRFTDLAPKGVKPFPLGMTIYGGATAIKVMEKSLTSIEVIPKVDAKPREIQMGGRTQIRRPRIEPGYKEKAKPFTWQPIETNWTIPPSPIPIQTQRQRQRTAQLPRFIQEQRRTQKALIPTVPHFGFQARPPRPVGRFRPPDVETKLEKEYRRGLFSGELRAYKMKSAKEILKLI